MDNAANKLLSRVAAFQFQIGIYGYDLAGETRQRRPGDVALDLVWEERRSPQTDYLGHPLWDHNRAWCNQIQLNGVRHLVEAFALPYVCDELRRQDQFVRDEFDELTHKF